MARRLIISFIRVATLTRSGLDRFAKGLLPCAFDHAEVGQMLPLQNLAPFMAEFDCLAFLEDQASEAKDFRVVM